MAMAYGRALMARDVGLERKELEKEEDRLQKEMEKQAKQQQKKGMWGSIGRTIGSIGAGAIGGMLGGPAGAVLAGKMVGGYLGGRLGQGAVKASKAGLKADVSGGKFLGEERRNLTRAGEQARRDFTDATTGMRSQLAFSSVANPLMSYATGGGKFTKEGLGSKFTGAGEFKPAAGLSGAEEWHSGNLWEQLLHQPEISSFLPTEKES